MTMPTPAARPVPQGRKIRIAVLDDYLDRALSLADWSALQDRADITVFTRAFASEAQAIEALQGYDVLSTMRERMDMPRSFFEGLPQLAAVGITGARNRTLDLQAARDHGVTVMHTGGAGNGAWATVELAWGLILSQMRAIHSSHAAMCRGGWQEELGNAVFGRVLGLVGLGRLGSRMVPIARAMGMDVLAWSPNLTEERAAAAGARLVRREELFARSDVISLHMVLGATTEGLIGAPDLARMRPGALIVNTSRGPLIQQAPLIEALEAGRIRAALDVYEVEPLPADAPIRRVPNLLLTPHLGYTVEETLEAMYRDTVENIAGWLDGRPMRVLAD